MGKIYNTNGIATPPIVTSFFGVGRSENWLEEYEDKCKEYVEEVKNWAKEKGKGKYSGEEVYFPHADGYARYVIISLKPLELLHLNVGDAWDLPHIERLTASDLIKKVESQRSL